MNANATIHPNQEQLAAYGLGKLDDAETAVVVEHLETCGACRRPSRTRRRIRSFTLYKLPGQRVNPHYCRS
jgi:anti-sigma factor ChrR (cupin superfamily)